MLVLLLSPMSFHGPATGAHSLGRAPAPRLVAPVPADSPPTAEPWGGDLAEEAAAAVAAVQRAMRLCNALACEMTIVNGDPTSGKTMDACDVEAGVSFIKPGDDTPVTAADFAIQGMISGLLREQFPDDRFMGEEDAADLRADSDLCTLALRLCTEYSQGARQSRVDDNLDVSGPHTLPARPPPPPRRSPPSALARLEGAAAS